MNQDIMRLQSELSAAQASSIAKDRMVEERDQTIREKEMESGGHKKELHVSGVVWCCV